LVPLNIPLHRQQQLGELGQQIGLNVINLLARLGRYRVQRGIAYGEQPRQCLDFYQHGRGSRVADEPLPPLILFIYGGGWRSGARQNYRFVADTLCRLGCDVVVADYRLYPDVRFEQMMQDVVLAGRWVADNTPEQQPVFVMGHSAGAQLGALLCLNQRCLAETGNLASRLKGFVGLAGPYDFYPFTEDDHWDLFGPEQDYPLSQAVNFVRADAPPLYLLHGEQDTRVRRGHSKSLMEKAQAAGGQASREVYENLGHTDIIVAFSALHRGRSSVVRDLANFILDPLGVIKRPLNNNNTGDAL
jgi:acetyl esterase/lipase